METYECVLSGRRHLRSIPEPMPDTECEPCKTLRHPVAQIVSDCPVNAETDSETCARDFASRYPVGSTIHGSYQIDRIDSVFLSRDDATYEVSGDVGLLLLVLFVVLLGSLFGAICHCCWCCKADL